MTDTATEVLKTELATAETSARARIAAKLNALELDVKTHKVICVLCGLGGLGIGLVAGIAMGHH